MKKILIFRHASLGDFIVGIPAISMIRKKFSNHKIYYLTNEQAGSGAVNPNKIFNNNKLIDEFIYINKKDKSFIGLIKLMIKLRNYQFEKFFYLNQTMNVKKFNILKNLLFFSVCKIKKVRGFDLLRYKPDYKKGNESFQLAKRVDANIKRKDIHKAINSSVKIDKNSQNLTLKKFISKTHPHNFITISGGLRNPIKDWGLKNWEVLLKGINNYYPTLKIIIVGSKKEYMRAKKLKIIKPGNIANLCGKTNIKELMEIISKSKFHISHDDGTMHVASIFNKKSIAIFSTLTEKFSWFPYNKNLNIFYPKISVKETKPHWVLKKFKENFS